ncbi:MAP kinase kinase (MEK) [Scheffersomyces spartinae]|uniref:MAP kinase kinase (MEK) n=1 Tax=Scheffersomyces spartinae TaxID=45513 RepID=A0A9P7V5U3_9ASCO|nr:MAP kinase kinase (MEK) [Scheffersomyces spartinae]KAG7191715.1 MAP kinase kinase (MEK) [Scheffersomyces spartinae]
MEASSVFRQTHINRSQTSVQDKELPPIPPPSSTEDESNNLQIRPSFSSTPRPSLDGLDDPKIMQVKSLKRKNLKQLSLNTLSPLGTCQPVLLGGGGALSLEECGFISLASTLSSASSELHQSHPLLSKSSLLHLSKVPSNSGSSSIRLTQNLKSTIDLESNSATSIIIDHLSDLDLRSKASKNSLVSSSSSINTTSTNGNDANRNHHSHQQRKRQTIISSISPTKSSSSSSPRASPITGIATSSSTTSGEDLKSPISTTASIKFNNEDIVTLKQLGSGNSGSVSKILHIPTQKTMAKKIIQIESKTIIQNQIIRELKILHECQSPYIIEFYGAFINTNNTVVICMEYCNCGSLDKILPFCEYHRFPLNVLKKLSFSILSGLTYLYDTHKIIHRDIKPSNVLMTHKGEFKLCDFGVSRELTNSLAMADTFVGTSVYMSPERIQGLTYGIKSDIWSMGLMIIELASGQHVWRNNEEDEEGTINGNGGHNGSFKRDNGPEGILDLLQRIVNEQPPTLTEKIQPITRIPYDPTLCAFIDLCLVKDDTKRRTPFELLKDSAGFLNGVQDGSYDKEIKTWAKGIRKQLKELHQEH